jgi:biopolymer transport protein ExbD
VTTTFNHQSSIPVALPQSSQAHSTGASENAPLIVSIDEKGILRLGTDPHAITLEQLKSQLQAQAEKNPGLVVAINADKNSSLGEFVKVWDAAKEAKVKAVNLSAKEPGKP